MGVQKPYPTDPWEPMDGLCNTRKTDGTGLCRHEAGWGTDHVGDGKCRKHGGTSPNLRAHAAKLRHARELDELLAEQLAGVEIVDPVAAVLEVVRRTWAWRRVLEMRAGELMDRTDLDGGEPAIYGRNHLGDQAPHVLFTMLEKATAQHLHACKVAIDAGVAERALRIEEDKLDLLAGMVRGIVTELGHSLDDPHVQEVVVRHLTAVPDAA